MKKIILFLFYNFLLLSFFPICPGQNAMSAPSTMIGDRPSSLLLLSLAVQYLKPEESAKVFKEINPLLQLLKKNKEDVKEKFHKTEKKFRFSYLETEITDKIIDDIYKPQNDEIKSLYHIIKKEKLNIKFKDPNYKSDIQNKLLSLTETLYLQATIDNDIKENKNTYKELSLIYHPDRTRDKNKDIQENFASFFKEFKSLLNENINGNHLTNLINDTNKQLHKRYKRIKEEQLSYSKIIFHTIIAPPLSYATYFAVAKTIRRFLPNKTINPILCKNITHLFHKSAFKIEKQLININSELLINQKKSLLF
jgi:hypothetical protein